MNSVLFVSFSMWSDGKRMPTNGNLEPLRDYLIPRVSRLILIDQPVPGSDRVLPIIEEYQNHNPEKITHKPGSAVSLLKAILEKQNVHGTRMSFKIRDFLSVVNWGLRDKALFDCLIGLESVNTLAGILLRKLGKVRTVIYYVLDYSPTRYENKLFNKLYLALDFFCARQANYIWDVSPAMQPARIEAGLDPSTSAPVIHVPIGLYPEQIKQAAEKDKKQNSLVYMGTLGEENGPDLAIECLPLVLKGFPQTTLQIIGGGEKNLARLRALADKLGVRDKVTFHGFVVESAKMTEIISKCYVALAPYRAIPGSIRYYADASKIRTYIAAGLPVVTTNVPPLGRELYEYGAAIIAKDNKKGFAEAIGQLFSNKQTYGKLKERAVNFGKNNTWEKEFSKAFAQMHD